MIILFLLSSILLYSVDRKVCVFDIHKIKSVKKDDEANIFSSVIKDNITTATLTKVGSRLKYVPIPPQIPETTLLVLDRKSFLSIINLLKKLLHKYNTLYLVKCFIKLLFYHK